MNPGIGEEAGKVASGAIDALKNQPIVLALVLMQVLTIGAILYNAIHRQNAADRQFVQLFELLQTCLKQNASPIDFKLQNDESIPVPLPRPRSPAKPAKDESDPHG